MSVAVDCERGRTFAFEPRSTALACIDFQTDFLSPDGMSARRGHPIGVLRETLEPARRILDAARRAGLMVFHTRECYAPDLSDLNAYRTSCDTIIGADGPLGRFLVRGEKGTEIVPEMAPRAGEPVIDKPGFSAFHNTGLDAILRERGISHLILIGITTQCCVSSTLRSAVDHGYFSLVIRDATAAFDEADKEASLRVIFSENHNFGWVASSDALVDALRAAEAVA